MLNNSKKFLLRIGLIILTGTANTMPVNAFSIDGGVTGILNDDVSGWNLQLPNLQEGKIFTMTLSSDDFDPKFELADSEGNVIISNDNISEENWSSRVTVTIPQTGNYQAIALRADEGEGRFYMSFQELTPEELEEKKVE
ncbi:MAG: hypothetical protein F6K29_34120, partial [Okeania sp. SIO2G5]|nr:hypothetical protein [Okeania sp. SIO2G5]